MDQWRSFTKLAEKAKAYSVDPLTRTAMSIADELSADLPELLWDLALIVVKPEALVSGRMNKVERFLTTRSLSVVSSFDVELDAVRSNALWSYPWVKATTDRIRLHILMSEGGPSRCLLVRRNARDIDIPLTMWLAERKGSSSTSLRTPDQLRTSLGMSNRMISFVHCSDEPADLLRDMYVVAGAPGVELLAAPRSRRLDSGSRASGASSTVVDLELPNLLEKLTGWGREQMSARLAARRGRNEVIGLAEAMRDVRRWGARGRWVEHALAAELIPYDLPGVSTLFDRLTVGQLANLWRDSARSRHSAPSPAR
jgi:hypothetical protein